MHWGLLIIFSCVQTTSYAADLPYTEDDITDLSKIEYNRYVFQLSTQFEANPKVRDQMLNMTTNNFDLEAAKQLLQQLPSDVRSQLNEAKRIELQRIHDAITGTRKKLRDRWTTSKTGHLDSDNQLFNEVDFVKLVKQLDHDLAIIRRSRKRKFKRHELQKEFEFRRQLENKTDQERKRLMDEKKHEKELQEHAKSVVDNPGSKHQLEDTWTQADELGDSEFDPKTLFKLHDKNNDGVLDDFEVETLFEPELHQLEVESNRTFDALELDEQRARMREYLMKHYDADKNNLISLEEFQNGFADADLRVGGWNKQDNVQEYSEKELEDYIQEHKDDSTNNHTVSASS